MKKFILYTILTLVALMLSFKVASAETGIASWYGPGFHGRLTASGERFNQYAMTAAHKTLPFGTIVRVTNLNNGRSIVVKINDRGPFKPRRIIDLSKAANQKLNCGLCKVKVAVIKKGDGKYRRQR